ncbi:MAG: flagellar basal body P-ring protein FlgI [Planctomycetota bacterium]
MPRYAGRSAVLLALAGAAWLALTACNDTPGVEPMPAPRTAANDELLTTGTVGAETLVTNGAPQELRGFGLVVGLNGRGSPDCPTPIRRALEDWLAKQVPPQTGTRGRRLQTPGELIDSPDTATVEIFGLVPPGARKGTRFDLQVRALAGTSTESLEGGCLLPTELKHFDSSSSVPGGLIGGAALAHGDGPININPFAAEGDGAAGTVLSPREGRILGGGRTIVERATRLTLIRPNYQLALAIERRVNERFGQRRKLAVAFSAQQVEISTPPEYERQYERFCAALAQLYLDNRPPILEQKLRAIATRAASPGADLDRILATWEAFGPTALPQIQPFYTDREPLLRLYAARAGLRLGDMTALPVLQAFAAGGAHDERLIAIRELGTCDSPQAPVALAPLLDDENQEVRLAAYEALLNRGHAGIQSLPFPHPEDPLQINFVLDVVNSSGPPLIYIRRTRLPRIAVFGNRIPVEAPLFYADPDDVVTVHTVEGSTDLQVYARRQNRLTDSIVMPPRLIELISALADLPKPDETGRLRGVGLPYSRVVQILAALTRNQTIPARLVFEQTPLTDLFGPERGRPDTGRPEAEPTERKPEPADGEPRPAHPPERAEPAPHEPLPEPLPPESEAAADADARPEGG